MWFLSRQYKTGYKTGQEKNYRWKVLHWKLPVLWFISEFIASEPHILWTAICIWDGISATQSQFSWIFLQLSLRLIILNNTLITENIANNLSFLGYQHITDCLSYLNMSGMNKNKGKVQGERNWLCKFWDGNLKIRNNF